MPLACQGLLHTGDHSSSNGLDWWQEGLAQANHTLTAEWQGLACLQIGAVACYSCCHDIPYGWSQCFRSSHALGCMPKSVMQAADPLWTPGLQAPIATCACLWKLSWRAFGDQRTPTGSELLGSLFVNPQLPQQDLLNVPSGMLVDLSFA